MCGKASYKNAQPILISFSSFSSGQHKPPIRKSTTMALYTGEAGYIQSLKDLLERNNIQKNRTEVDAYRGVPTMFVYDLSEDKFPLFTTKYMPQEIILAELLFFMRGQTNVKILQDQNVRIWDANTSKEFMESRALGHYEEGDAGPIYGFQWRHFGAKYEGMNADYTGKGVDQLQWIIDTINNNDEEQMRRLIMSAWNPPDLPMMALPPCHVLYTFTVDRDTNTISCTLFQRSGDAGLGVPFNVASASALTYVIGKFTNLKPDKLYHTVVDYHLYVEHVEPIMKAKMLERKPYEPPKLVIGGEATCVDDIKIEDFVITNYSHHPRVRMPMAV